MRVTKADWELNKQHGIAEIDGFIESFAPGNFWSADEGKASWWRIDVEMHSAMGQYLAHVNEDKQACLGSQFSLSAIASYHMAKMEAWDLTKKERENPRIFQVSWYKLLTQGMEFHKDQIKDDTYENFMEGIHRHPEMEIEFEEQINALKAKKH